MKIREDSEREDRIEKNALVDTYSADEALSGWYAYLEDTISFPFKIASKNKIIKTVSGLCCIEEFDGDFYVWIEIDNDQMMVGIRDLKIIEASQQTVQVIEDWQYFCARGDHYYLIENEEEEE